MPIFLCRMSLRFRLLAKDDSSEKGGGGGGEIDGANSWPSECICSTGIYPSFQNSLDNALNDVKGIGVLPQGRPPVAKNRYRKMNCRLSGP